MKVTYEEMSEQHAADVMAIFNYYVENGFSAFPETCLPEPFFQKFLEMTKGYPAFVMKTDDNPAVAGFCFLRPHSPFPVFRRTAEITCFLKPDSTGKGLGRAALEKLEVEAQNRGISYILAGISSRNEQSLIFHRKNGFYECGRFRNIGTKKGTAFDVIWMQKDLLIR